MVPHTRLFVPLITASVSAPTTARNLVSESFTTIPQLQRGEKKKYIECRNLLNKMRTS